MKYLNKIYGSGRISEGIQGETLEKLSVTSLEKYLQGILLEITRQNFWKNFWTSGGTPAGITEGNHLRISGVIPDEIPADIPVTNSKGI